jgi:hypothetical protein
MDFDDLFDRDSHRGRRRGRDDHEDHHGRGDRDDHGDRDRHGDREGRGQLELDDHDHGQGGRDRQAHAHDDWGSDRHESRRGSERHDDSDAWPLDQGRRHGGIAELLRWLATGPLRSTRARVLAGAAAAVVLVLLGALAVGAVRLALRLPLEGLAAPAVEAARSVLMGK